MKLSFSYSGLKEALDGARDEAAQRNTAAIAEATDSLKQALRDQVSAAGLGYRLANTWRSKVYPQAGVAIDPAGLVWSKAPRIIDAFDRGVTIVPVNGQRYLAIPTENVPPKAGGRGLGKMSPLDVEVAFNQDLIIRKEPNGNLLAFVSVVPALSGKGYRVATKKRGAQGRVAKPILMFVLTPNVTLAKRLDIDGAAAAAAANVVRLAGSD